MVIVITGVMAAGKSTAAQRLAERLPRAVHVRGDVFRRMIVTGRAEPTPGGSAQATASTEAPAGSRLPSRGSATGAATSGRAGSGGRRRGGAGPWEERRQLELRYRLSAQTADAYADAGFTVVVQDVILGADLPAYAAMVRARPCFVVVLAPRGDVVAERDAQRAKTGYGSAWTVGALAASLAETPRIGFWLDNSDLTVEQTVDQVLAYVTNPCACK